MDRLGEILGGTMEEVFAPVERVSPSQWADRHAWLMVDGTRTKYQTAITPHMREPLDAFAEDAVTDLTIMKAAQVGGTKAMLMGLGYSIDTRPTRTLVVYPNEIVAQNQNKEEVMPFVLATDRLRSRLGPYQRDKSNLRLRFTRTSVLFAGSNSQSNLEGLDYGLVIVDELDRCDPSVVDVVRSRGRTKKRRKLVRLGTPTLVGYGIHHEYMQGDRRRLFVPCPLCRAYHARDWNHVRWPGVNRHGERSDATRDVLAPIEAAMAGAWMRCPSCGGQIPGSANTWQIARCVWVPEGCTIEPLPIEGMSDPSRVPAWKGTPRTTTHRSYWLDGLYQTMPAGVNPYGAVVERYLEAKGETQEFRNRTLGHGFELKGQAAEVKHVRQMAKRQADGGYRLGTVPHGVLAITAAIDVQESHCYMEVVGWTKGGESRYLIEYHRIEAPSDISLEGQLFPHLARTWKVIDGPTLGLWAAFIDSGHRTHDVYALSLLPRPRRPAWICPVKGVSGERMNTLHRLSTLEHLPDGKPVENLKLLLVNTWQWKHAVLSQLRMPSQRADDDAATLNGPSPGVFHLPEDVSDEYLRQITAEQFVTHKTKTGKSVHEWKLRADRTANHYLDCRVYNEAGAHSKGVKLLDAYVNEVGAKPAAKAAPPPPPAQSFRTPMPIGPTAMGMRPRQ